MTELVENKNSVIVFDDKMQSLAVELGINIEDPIEARQQAAIEKTNQALKLVIEAGVCFASIRHELPHGQFESWLDQQGVAKQRAYEAMSLANFSKALPPKERAQLFSVPKTKAMLLAKADKEIIDQLIEETGSEDLKELGELSFRDMRDRIRELEAKNADLTIEGETKDVQIKTLNDRASQRRNFNSDYPDFVNLSRDESNAFATEISLRIDEIDRLINDLIDSAPAADAAMVSLAATNMHIHINALVARACELSKKMTAQFGEHITELSGEHMLTPEEIEQAIRDRSTMIQEMEQQQRIRDDRRENAKPKKAGRPKSK